MSKHEVLDCAASLAQCLTGSGVNQYDSHRHDAQSVDTLTIKAEADNEADMWTTGPTNLPRIFKLLNEAVLQIQAAQPF